MKNVFSSLATAVAQLYLALPSDRTHWSKLGAGVVCLVKDKQEKSFFIRFLDIKEKCVVWEQELYKQFKYRAVSKYFQTFFAHNCRAGINFASTEEAALFRAAIMERVNVFKRKRDEMRQRKLAAYQQQQQMNFQMNALQAIQNPYFRMQFMPPSMQSMMMMQMRAPAVAASQRAQLQAMFNSMPPETRQAFLMNMKSGGSMASMYGQPSMSGMLAGPAGRNFSNFAIPSAPSQQVPHHPHAPPHAHHMKPSHETHSTFHPPPLEPSRPAPPVPVEPKSSAPLPTEAALTAVPPPPGPATPPSPGPAAPPPPESGAPAPPGPAAPPPPPPGPAAPPPPPPPPAPSAPSTPSSPVSSGSIISSGSVDRGGLLQSIQAGTKLRKVGESTSSRKAIPKVESHSMRGALARALDNRAKVLGDEDSDDDDEWDDDDDDDWSD